MKSLKVKSMHFLQSDKFGLIPIFDLEDGRRITGKWHPTGSCFDFSFELIQCKLCNHPGMKGECCNGKIICCKWCDQVEECMKEEDNDNICPFIKNKNDLKEMCPFEIEVS